MGVLQNINAFLDSLYKTTNIGFLLYDNFVTFLRVGKDHNDQFEISMIRNVDNMNCASISRKDLFFNVETNKPIIEHLISFL